MVDSNMKLGIRLMKITSITMLAITLFSAVFEKQLLLDIDSLRLVLVFCCIFIVIVTISSFIVLGSIALIGIIKDRRAWKIYTYPLSISFVNLIIVLTLTLIAGHFLIGNYKG